MRQYAPVKEALDFVESGSLLEKKKINAYKKSQLSELSRPPDLREIDMGIEGIVEVFFQYLVSTVWSCIDKAVYAAAER